MKLRVRLFVRLLVGLLVCGGVAQAQQITITNTIPNSVCAGSTIRVDYSYPSYIEFERHTLYVYLNSASGRSIVASPSSVTHNASIDVPIPPNQPTGSYTLDLQLTVKPVATDSYTTVSPVSNLFSINTTPPPPTVTNLSACQNTTPPLITSAVINPSGILNWYTSSAASTTVAPGLSTSATGTSSYSVSQSVNGCESPRNTITYTVRNLPSTPTISPNSLLYCQGVQAPALISSSNGNTLTWYTDPAGTMPLPGQTPLTIDARATPYYARLTDGNGCQSPLPLSSLTVVVSSRPTSPTVTQPQPITYCQGNSSVTLSATATGTNGLTWYDQSGAIISPTISIANPGTTTYYVSQTDGNTCVSDRASIIVTVIPKPASPGVQAISACQNTTPQSIITAITSFEGTLKWYSPTSMSLAAAPTLSSSAPGTTYYGVSQINQYGCESAPASVTYTVKNLPSAPTVASNPVILCQSSIAVPLSAVGTGTLNWYDPSNNVYASIRPNTDIVGSIVYRVTQTVDGCESLPANLTVIVIAKPVLPTVYPPAPYCQFSTPVSLSATGQGLKWYLSTAGRPASYSITAPIPSTDQEGTTTYYVTQTDANGCESDRASIDVQVKLKPKPPGTPPLSFCANNVTALTASPDPGGQLIWYGTSANPTSPTTTAPTPATAITGTPVTYYVSQTVNGCESDKATLDVTINALPKAPAVTAAPIYYCLGATASPLSATADTGGSLVWYDPNSITPLPDAPKPLTISANPPTTIYYVSQKVNGCEGPRASIAVTINQLPVKPTVATSLSFCQGPSSVTLSATATGTNGLTWYDQNGTVISPVISTTNSATTPYFVSQTDAITQCVSERATTTVTIIATPQIPVLASPTVTLCLNTTPTALTAIAPDGGQLKWYDKNGTALGTAAPIPSTSTTGTTTYSVSQSVGLCEGPRTIITVIVKPLPPKPTVISPLSFCKNSSPGSLSATGTGTLYWYTDPNGTFSTQTPTISTSAVGSTTYSVSQFVDGCESLKEAIVVSIRALPQAPTVSASTIGRCQNTGSVPLSASGASTGTLYWYLPNGTSTIATPIVSTSVTGSFSYSVSQRVEGCESEKTSITVTVTAAPDAPVTAPASFCYMGPATPLSATATGSLNWYKADGTALGTTFSPPTNITGLTVYYVSQSVNGCESTRAPLAVTIRAAPNPPNPVSFIFCQNTTATSLTAVANSGTLNWYDLPTGGTGSTVAPPTPTNVATTLYRFVSLTDANGCESPRTTVTVIINAQPNAPTTTPLSVCQNTTAPPLTLSVKATGALRWYSDQLVGTPSPVTPIPLTTKDGPQTYFVSQTDAVTGCESPRTLLLVTVTPTPGAPVVLATAPVCQGPTPVVLTAGGQNLKWYADNASTTPISQGSSFIQSAAQAVPFTYFVSQTVSSCEGPRATVQGVVNAVPTPPAVTPIQSGCQDAQVQPLTAVGTSLQWYNQNDELIGTPTPNTRIDATQTTTYRVTQTVNGCTSIKANLAYTVNVTPAPSVASPVDFCQTQAAKQLTAVGTSLKWYDPSGTVTTGLVTTAGSYSVTQTAQGCESRKKEVIVTISPQATATLAGSASISQGSSATLTLTGSGSYTYVLTNETTGAVVTTGTVVSTSPTGTTVQPIVVTPGATTTYKIQSITNGCGAGIGSGSALVTVYKPTIATGTPSLTFICAGTPFNVSFTSTGTFAPGNTFTAEIAPVTGNPAALVYTPLPTSAVQGQSQSLYVQIPTAIAAGQYHLRISASNATYPISGDTSQTRLTVRSLPTASLSASKTSVDRVGGKSLPVELLVNLSGERPWSVTYTATTATSKSQSTTTTDANPYRFTVTPDTTTIYRLVAVSSSNGCGLGRIEGVDSVRITVNPVTATEPDPFSNTVKVYPVPTNGMVTVDIDLPLPQPAQFRLTNLDGQTTQQLTTQQRQTTISLDKEPGGTYLLYIKIGDKWTVRRILKW